MRIIAVVAVMLLAAACGQEPAAPVSVAADTTGAANNTVVVPGFSRATSNGSLAVATFAAGCFWCTEADFDKVPGVVSTTSGYTGGRVVNPTYEQVSSGGTGHAEAVRVMFDPAIVGYDDLLDVYWHNVDPFSARGQFCDFGEQYRPAIFVHGATQRAAAEQSKARVERLLGKRVVVTIDEAGPFYAAEAYHQDYHRRSAVRYKYYRWGCGRDARLSEIWR